MDRPGNDGRKQSPMGDRRDHPVLCGKCRGAKTMNIAAVCDDCLDLPVAGLAASGRRRR